MDFDQRPSRMGTRFSAILVKSKIGESEKEGEDAKA
jgi:hypothetical protein